MRKTYLSYNNIISTLGFDTPSVVKKISNEITGLKVIEDTSLLPEVFCASIIPSEKIATAFSEIADPSSFTRLEQLMLLSLKKTITASGIAIDEKVGLIISTTKGNIDVLEEGSLFSQERAYLSTLGKTIQKFFNFQNEAIVLSNACVSGILAVSVAKSFIAEGEFDHVFIVSADLVTPFILSGFQSFQALSSEVCKPYDKNRIGINLGEVAASVLVTSDKNSLAPEAVAILGDGSCNDANHISGPSRTGEGLYRSVRSALKQTNLHPSGIDYISAHGTATPFNDEMEAIAFNRLGLNEVPVNSLKGYFGHTLGASGLLETLIGMHSLYNNTLYASLGFEEIGVSQPINVISKTTPAVLNTFLKTASGFGGCNTAVIFQKIKNNNQ